MVREFFLRPESVSFRCPYCDFTIRLADRAKAVAVSEPGARRVQYAHGDCAEAEERRQRPLPRKRRLTVIEGGHQ